MSPKHQVIVVLLAAIWQLSWQVSLPTDATYRAGVVEFQPSTETIAKSRVKDNLKRMKEVIESEETHDLDILVFPEYVLNNMEFQTFVPDPKDLIAPCEIPNYDYFLTELSCATRSRNLYVVLNLLEKEFCDANATTAKTACDPSGFNTYNTNVVLDRRGRVISRYRKSHLYRYEWYSTNVLAEPELATFSTDFGVTFGHFICFDMLFYEPAEVLVRILNVTDIIYPTYWFSELPFLTAVQLQEGWAYANNVNLLAADASVPAAQNTGSGIYAGKFGRLTAAINEEATTQLLAAVVPKHGYSGYQVPPIIVPAFQPQFETARYTKLSLLRDYNVDLFSTTLLPSDFTSVGESLCHGDFCCRFDVQRTFVGNSSRHASYQYRLVAYSGARTTHQRIDRSALSVCAIVACTSAELYSCGHIYPDGVLVGNEYYFQAINISGSFPNAAQRLIMPTSVDGGIMPLPVAMYTMTEVESANGTDVAIALTTPKNDLLTFGIWANYYAPDEGTHNLNIVSEPLQRNGAAVLAPAVPLLVLLAVAVARAVSH